MVGMSVGVQLGLVLAVATALASIVGFLYKHRGAVESPRVDWRRPVWSLLVLFRSPWYTLGVLVAMAGWGLHVAALSLAPISLVQATIAGGLVMLTVIADRLFGFQVTRREWIGVALTAAGLAFLAATMGEGGVSDAHSDYDTGVLAAYAGGAFVLGVIAALGDGRVAPGIGLAASAGLIWGASDVSIKALSDHTGEGFVGVMTHPLAPIIALLSAIGLVVSAKSLQDGKAVPVIAVTSAAANVCTIASGPIVFGEPLPDEPLALAVRLLAFVLVIGAATLTPPPGAGREDDAEDAEQVPPRVAHETA
jgi:drug/metabolite transporter (DMT)-like permease